MKRKIIITIIILVLAVALATGLVVLKKRGFQAFENPPLIAELSATITEDGSPATGQFLIDGDCPATELGGVDGGFYCELTTADSSAQKLRINSLSFFSYTTDQTLQIPLQISVPTEPQPFTLQSGEKLILDIVINASTNSIVIRRWNEATNQFDPFPPSES